MYMGAGHSGGRWPERASLCHLARPGLCGELISRHTHSNFRKPLVGRDGNKRERDWVIN